jgi:versiconal hemiacetal acetate esterase
MASLERVVADVKQARQNATSFGGDLNKFYSIGGSAGGALALQLANRIVKDPSKRDGIKGVAAIVPCTLHYDYVPEEYKSMFKAFQENEKDVPIIDKESMRSFYDFAGVDP